ncbi:hypothetical protein AVEN_227357-1 [Araneus ventricosus]|uniref:Uncharacterized protein n=1 Tax=Araneus ventricosus TaxID=182803 RepID=A0A4Y2GVL4_ARAVE|nr:hypothetical protein AVEN_227357-1 [Araneus ventricosus]
MVVLPPTSVDPHREVSIILPTPPSAKRAQRKEFSAPSRWHTSCFLVRHRWNEAVAHIDHRRTGPVCEPTLLHSKTRVGRSIVQFIKQHGSVRGLIHMLLALWHRPLSKRKVGLYQKRVIIPAKPSPHVGVAQSSLHGSRESFLQFFEMDFAGLEGCEFARFHGGSHEIVSENLIAPSLWRALQ